MSSDGDLLISLLRTAQLRMHPKDAVIFTVVKSAIVMENIMKEYTLLAKVVSSLCFQHMRLVLGRSTRRSCHIQSCSTAPIEAEKPGPCTSLYLPLDDTGK
jgi:hypothetical protein